MSVVGIKVDDVRLASAAEWLVRQPPGHSVTRCAFATAAAAALPRAGIVHRLDKDTSG